MMPRKTLSPMFHLWLLIVLGLNACASNPMENPTAPVILPGDQLINPAASNAPITPVITETSLPPAKVTSISSIQSIASSTKTLPDDCSEPNTLLSQASPDRQWIAKSAGDLGSLAIRSCHDSDAWELSFEEIAGIPPCIEFTNRFGDMDCFYGILYIHHWDKDSRYVFIDVNYLIDRAYDFSYGLYRLDVKTHKISPWLPSTPDFTYRYAFSPNNKFLAYVSSADTHTIFLNSIETGQISNYKIPGEAYDVADLVWSPDNQKVAFSILHENWFENAGRISVGLLDLERGKAFILIPEDQSKFYPTDWSSDTVIKLSNRSGLPDYRYDLQTHELSEIQ